jgi:hypothetical protein
MWLIVIEGPGIRLSGTVTETQAEVLSERAVAAGWCWSARRCG